MARRPPSDPSVDQEPHFLDDGYELDPSEQAAEQLLASSETQETDDERVVRTVWDEPALSPELAGRPGRGALTYQTWFSKRVMETSVQKSWLVTAGAALASGPWAILGALWGSPQTPSGVMAIAVFAPAVEEIMKVAVPLVLLEKKPYLYRSRAQLVITVLVGALCFAAVENLIYLHVYVPHPSQALVRWRWSVTLFLHPAASLVSSLGLMRVWQDVRRRLRPPRLELAYPYLVAAIVLHGGYNLFAVSLETVAHPF